MKSRLKWRSGRQIGESVSKSEKIWVKERSVLNQSRVLVRTKYYLLCSHCDLPDSNKHVANAMWWIYMQSRSKVGPVWDGNERQLRSWESKRVLVILVHTNVVHVVIHHKTSCVYGWKAPGPWAGALMDTCHQWCEWIIFFHSESSGYYIRDNRGAVIWRGGWTWGWKGQIGRQRGGQGFVQTTDWKGIHDV